jgi:hypothetical protein
MKINEISQTLFTYDFTRQQLQQIEINRISN